MAGRGNHGHKSHLARANAKAARPSLFDLTGALSTKIDVMRSTTYEELAKADAALSAVPKAMQDHVGSVQAQLDRQIAAIEGQVDAHSKRVAEWTEVLQSSLTPRFYPPPKKGQADARKQDVDPDQARIPPKER